MGPRNSDNKKLWLTAAGLITVLAVLGLLFFNSALSPVSETGPDSKTASPGKQGPSTGDPQEVKGKIIVKPDIDYQNLGQDQELKQLMGERKQNLGIKQSLDMIVKSDESFKVGDNKVSMQDILEKSKIQKGEIFTRKIKESGAVLPDDISEYGIYVVQPNDNIWNIHFNILKEYYENQGINVSPKADEPMNKGLSSGVGKILKFSETMVVIYNMVDKKVVSGLDLLEPLSKVVVYNMDEVFSLLSTINYENIDRLQFDGKTIWIPAKK